MPRCPECRKVLRPHVLWFDEHYHDHVDYQMAGVADVISDWTTLVFVGTSHAVGITDTLLEAAEHDGLPIFNIDLVAAYLPGVHDIVGPAEVVLPRLAEAVGYSTRYREASQ